MGCACSKEERQVVAVGQHMVSLISTTYGLLSLDHPPTFPSQPQAEVINSWELMSGLDTDSFRFYPPFRRICPPNGENRLVIYTTTLRGVRATFEACNAVRAAFQAFGVVFCERDVSMHIAFREELRALFKATHFDSTLLPTVFLKGFYIGGSDQILKLADQGLLPDLLHGLPTKHVGSVCHRCADIRFLPCFHCNGSCKILVNQDRFTLFAKCSHCNENGLVLCPLCS